MFFNKPQDTVENILSSFSETVSKLRQLADKNQFIAESNTIAIQYLHEENLELDTEREKAIQVAVKLAAMIE